ncbi:MAG: hypothetical protein ACR2OX_04260, partial [Methyloligellaceae bacterium]
MKWKLEGRLRPTRLRRFLVPIIALLTILAPYIGSAVGQENKINDMLTPDTETSVPHEQEAKPSESPLPKQTDS